MCCIISAYLIFTNKCYKEETRKPCHIWRVGASYWPWSSHWCLESKDDAFFFFFFFFSYGQSFRISVAGGEAELERVSRTTGDSNLPFGPNPPKVAQPANWPATDGPICHRQSNFPSSLDKLVTGHNFQFVISHSQFGPYLLENDNLSLFL